MTAGSRSVPDNLLKQTRSPSSVWRRRPGRVRRPGLGDRRLVEVVAGTTQVGSVAGRAAPVPRSRAAVSVRATTARPSGVHDGLVRRSPRQERRDGAALRTVCGHELGRRLRRRGAGTRRRRRPSPGRRPAPPRRRRAPCGRPCRAPTRRSRAPCRGCRPAACTAVAAVAAAWPLVGGTAAAPASGVGVGSGLGC